MSDAHLVAEAIGSKHTHPFMALFPGLPRSAGTRKVKPIWILLKQETLSGSGISWMEVCTTQFLQAGCPSCRQTNSMKGTVGTVGSKHCNRVKVVKGKTWITVVDRPVQLTSWVKDATALHWLSGIGFLPA